MSLYVSMIFNTRWNRCYVYVHLIDSSQTENSLTIYKMLFPASMSSSNSNKLSIPQYHINFLRSQSDSCPEERSKKKKPLDPSICRWSSVTRRRGTESRHAVRFFLRRFPYNWLGRRSRDREVSFASTL